MKCAYCGREIHEYKEKYELLSCDGDFIHVACKPDWYKQCDKINNMTNDEFKGWLNGEEV